MTSSRGRITAEACAALTAAFIAIPLAELPAQGAATPTPTVDGTVSPRAAHVRPPRGPQLSIELGDGRTMAKAGDQLSYAVSVRNAGSSPARRLAITLTLPTGVRLISTSRNGAARAGKITWRAGVPAGQRESFRAVGEVMRTPARMGRLAAVACAAERSGRPLVCAADLDQSAAAGQVGNSGAPTAGLPLGYAGAAGGVLAAGALAMFVFSRRSRASRRIRHSG